MAFNSSLISHTSFGIYKNHFILIFGNIHYNKKVYEQNLEFVHDLSLLYPFL